MDRQQARSDERDNRRVFRWGVIAVIIVLIGALAYNYVGHKRGIQFPDQGTAHVAPPPPLSGDGAPK